MDNTQFYRDSSSTASFFVPRHKVSYILPNQVMQSWVHTRADAGLSCRVFFLAVIVALVCCPRQFEERVLRVYSRSSESSKVNAIQVRSCRT